MTVQSSDLYEMLKKIRYDCTAIQAKVTDALNILNALNLPDPAEHVCPHCGISRPGINPLAEHVHHSHDGPVPAHWLAIEARSEEATV